MISLWTGPPLLFFSHHHSADFLLVVFLLALLSGRGADAGCWSGLLTTAPTWARAGRGGGTTGLDDDTTTIPELHHCGGPIPPVGEL